MPIAAPGPLLHAGTDTSVCTALAVLLACFRLPEQQQQQGGQQELQGRAGSKATQAAPGRLKLPAAAAQPGGSPAFYQPFSGDPDTLTPLPAAPGLKKLAVVSAYCPQARPTRGVL
jgi:hypothetical protein